MARAARILDDSILIELRRAIIAFGEQIDRSIGDAVGDVSRIDSWMHHEQLVFCRREAQQKEERFGESKVRLLEARSRIGYLGRPSIVTEEADFRRCRAECEAALARLERLRRSMVNLARDVDGPVTLLRNLRLELQQQIETSVRSIDGMLDGIATYTQQSKPLGLIEEPAGDEEEPACD